MPFTQEAKELPVQENPVPEKMFPVQEKNAVDPKKWRFMYNEKNEPVTVGLLSDNSITVEGKEIRVEIIFNIQRPSLYYRSDIVINTGGVQMIRYNTIDTGLRTTMATRLKPELFLVSGVTGTKHRVDWDEKIGMYYFINSIPMDRSISDEDRQRRHKYWNRSLFSFFDMPSDFVGWDNMQTLLLIKSPFAGVYEGFKMTFSIEFATNAHGKWESVFFTFDPSDFPDSMKQELKPYF